MQISIPYGRTHISAEIPGERIQAVLRSHLESYIPATGESEQTTHREVVRIFCT